jgi:hypothetical protein
MLDVRVALLKIVDRVLNNYNTNEGWVVKKTRSKYVNRIAAILPIIYQINKVQYFNNKFAMMINKANHGESVNCNYVQLVKELIEWESVKKT